MSDSDNKTSTADGAHDTPPLPSGLHGKPWDDKASLKDVFSVGGDDKYEPGEKFAHGGMGDIYEAFDNNCKRVVAMKVMRDKVKSKENIYRFIVEAQITAQLEHPNIVPVHDLSLDAENRLFYSMKKIEGITLTSILQKLQTGNEEYAQKYPLTTLLNIFQNICDAVAYAHSKGIIHRDLKPKNIMIGDFGEVLVLDWGIAKVLESSPYREPVTVYDEILKQVAADTNESSEEDLTVQGDLIDTGNLPEKFQELEIISESSDRDTPPSEDRTAVPHSASEESFNTYIGDILGTMGYMAPEQHQGRVRKIDARTDIFSLGVILYYILTLRPPFSPSNPKKLYQNLKEGRIPSPAKLARDSRKGDKDKAPELAHFSGNRVSASLSAVTMKAMAFKSSNRYESVEDLQDDIRKYQSGFATSAEDAGAAKLLILLIKRQRILACCILVIIPLLLVYVLQVMKSEQLARAHQRRAEKNAVTAKRESLNAKHQLAQSLIAEGNALATLSQWERASEKYRSSSDVLTSINTSIFPARLGLWNAYRHSPPVVNSLSGHATPVLAIAVSEDGTQVASGSSDGELILWNPRTSGIIHRFLSTQQQNPIVSLAIASDNTFILSGHYDGSVKRWNIATGQLEHSLHAHTRWITSIAISPDTYSAASTSTGEKVVLWDLKTRKQVNSLKGFQGGATTVTFSPDGRKLVIGADDYTIALWDLSTGDRIRTFKGSDDITSVLRFGPDVGTMTSGGLDGVVRVWDIDSGAEKYQLNGGNSAVLDLEFQADQQALVAADKGSTITLWNLPDRAPRWRRQRPGPPATAFAFSPDAAIAISNGQDRDLSIFAVDGTSEVQKLRGHAGPVSCAAYSEDAKLAVSGGWDKTVHLWDVATGESIAISKDHQRAVTAVAFLGNNRRILSASLDGTIRIWDPVSGEKQSFDLEEGAIVRVAVSPDYKFALVGHRTGSIVLWSLQSQATQRVLVAEGKPIRALTFSADGTIAMAAADDGRITLFAVPGFSEIQMPPIDSLRSAAISTDGRRIVTGSRTGQIKVWQVGSGLAIVETAPGTGSSSEIMSIIFSPDNQYIYAGDRNARVRIADANSGKIIADFREHDKGITAIAVSPDGGRIITGSRDKVLNIWDFGTPVIYDTFHEQLETAFSQLVSNPHDYRVFRTIGEWYMFRGLHSWALPFLEEAERRGDTDVSLSLARCYWKESRFSEADTAFEDISKQGRVTNDYITLLRQALASKLDEKNK